MFGSVILDVAVGLGFVYLLASLICSALRESLEAWFKTRAVYLERGIRELLASDKGLANDLYRHPLVHALFSGEYDVAKVDKRRWWQRTNLPTYIPAANFTNALLDLAVRGRDASKASAAAAGAAPISLASVRSAVASIEQPQVQRALLTAIDVAQGDLDRARAGIEEWYNSAMDRVAGWYKRRTQVYLLLLGFGLAVAANIDTVRVARYLYRDPATREALVASASAAVRDSAYQRASLDTLLGRLRGLDLPIGWSHGLTGERDAGAVPAPASTIGAAGSESIGRQIARWSSVLLGWLMTALAVSLGAPFWFDLLNRFVTIRSTVKPRPKVPEPGAGPPPAVQLVVAAERVGPAGAAPEHRELGAQLPDQPAVQP